MSLECYARPNNPRQGSSRLRMLMSITDTGEGMNPLGIIVTQNQKQKTSGGHSLS